MSHKQQIKAMQIIKESIKSPKRFNIMEIGSYDVNGTIRNIFDYDKYYGVDLSPGPNVNLVGSGHEIDLCSENINLCISTECFEHNPFWKETLVNMSKHLRDGGYIIITSAILGRLEHGTSRTDPKHSPGTNSIGWSYYKNIDPEEFSVFVQSLPGFKKYFLYTQSVTFDLYAVILIGDTANYTVDINSLQRLKDLNKLDWTFKGILFQLWLMPMRFIKLFFEEDKYLSVGVVYERITKRLFQHVVKKYR